MTGTGLEKYRGARCVKLAAWAMRAPDAVHKTAALQDNESEAAQITDEEGGSGLNTPLEVAKNLTVLLLGVLALLLILLAVTTASAREEPLHTRLRLRYTCP